MSVNDYTCGMLHIKVNESSWMFNACLNENSRQLGAFFERQRLTRNLINAFIPSRKLRQLCSHYDIFMLSRFTKRFVVIFDLKMCAVPHLCKGAAKKKKPNFAVRTCKAPSEQCSTWFLYQWCRGERPSLSTAHDQYVLQAEVLRPPPPTSSQRCWKDAVLP